MNENPMCADPCNPCLPLPPLSDEAVVEILDFPRLFTANLENQYSGQIHRYYDSRKRYNILAATPRVTKIADQLGIRRYQTAFQLLHKLRAGMVHPERDRIGGNWAVEVDETLVGGKTRGEGHGVHHKTYVVGAVEAREKSAKRGRRSMYAGAFGC